MVVACGVPAGKWPCPGGAGCGAASTGVEVECGGDARASAVVMLWCVQGARRARTGARGARHWHVWARCVQVNVVHVFVESGVWHDQESEGE